MDHISKSKEQNTGGIQLLKYAPIDWILDIPIAIDGQIADEIAFKSGTSWLDIYFVRFSAGYIETMNENDDGIFFDQALQLTINRNTPTQKQAIDQLKRRRLIFLIYDQNYQEANVPPILVGNIENWMSFLRTRKTGKQPSDLNHTAISFKGRTFEASPYYTFGMN